MKNKLSPFRILLAILLILLIIGGLFAQTNNVFSRSIISKPALSQGTPQAASKAASPGGVAAGSASPVAGDPSSTANNNSSLKVTDNKTTLDSLSFPIRAAFYYPWFPEAWTQQGMHPYTNYQPTLSYYDSSDPAIIRQQMSAMLYGNIEAGIASWWGQGSATDNRIPALLSAAAGTTFKWSIYYEPEGVGNPDVSTLMADLIYLRDKYSRDPGYLRIDSRFVVFVYADPGDGCEMVDRWHQANTVNAYIVLKIFPGYRSCANQPDGWHQYNPAKAMDSLGTYSNTISPGFWKAGQNPLLARNLEIWQQDIRKMTASGANFQLITTFNEWGEGTAVESAAEWASASGYGAYLDALHNNGQASTTP